MLYLLTHHKIFVTLMYLDKYDLEKRAVSNHPITYHKKESILVYLQQILSVLILFDIYSYEKLLMNYTIFCINEM